MGEPMTIEQAREQLASKYPASLVDSKGRQHDCIPRKAILRGDWDQGAVAKLLATTPAEA